MEKSKRETGGIAKFIEEAKRYRDDPTVLNNIIEAMGEKIYELQAKADAYDRLMSGGKKTLKEWANILGKPVAVDVEGRLCWFPKKPEIGLTTWIWYDNQFGCFGEYLPKNLIDFSGDWTDSLTLPDGWEEK